MYNGNQSVMNRNIFLSVNDNPTYSEFVPIVASAWRKWGYNVKLIAVSDDKAKMKWMEDYADVIHVKTRPDIEEGVWTKVARILQYSKHKGLNMVSDIDMIPLNENYFKQAFDVAEANQDKFISLSYDSHEGAMVPEGGEWKKFAGCYMIATHKIWKAIINPEYYEDDILLYTWRGRSIFDLKEDINTSSEVFSEESLIRKLVYKWSRDKSKIMGFNRGFIQGQLLKDRIDRSNWMYDNKKLQSGYYKDCHGLRPLGKHVKVVEPLVKYLGLDRSLLYEGIKKSNKNRKL